jgi:hypothetical protein
MSTVRNQWGLACPKCASDDYLQVQITVMANLYPEGTDPHGDQGWDGTSFIRCYNCHHTGTVRQFTVEEIYP